ncbi:hypothetical protein K6L44_06670 [Gluconacetobacter entanii]|uniref:hypothetical protein n=1 Tax=Gluconacetobacter entanii TaxID=108528 RepID=UPI001C932B9F|nr:hypothetical protein [Gluconacetobacter entanii]MBY4639685.1 hypothetical protein [Gluconacetobacter entanii]MCW4579189.1 hypothetical protein [Gluconacetobacter entanii]MCW4582579.1 hypothetical protein [Gluconacetobacter entanii]MCW4585972.1 hypothetical protein [Gluconacetobacter entanii]
MTNEQYYLVRLPLTDGQETSIRSELLEGPILDGAHMFAHLMGIVGTSIQPCADVETIGYGREASFADLKNTGCHGVSIHKEWDGGIPLVRRTDMEAQVAVRDAEIARLREMLSLFVEYEKLMDDGEDGAGMIVYAEFAKQARAALNEGAAA